MTPFKQKIMAAAASEIDTFDMLDVTCKAFPMSFHKRERKDAEFVYKRAFSAANLRLTPLITRLVDDVEALKAALGAIEALIVNPQSMTDAKLMLGQVERIAADQLEAHLKRWEDLK